MTGQDAVLIVSAVMLLLVAGELAGMALDRWRDRRRRR